MDTKTVLVFFLALAAVLTVSIICKHKRQKDMKEHKKFSIAKIYKKSGSLNNSIDWHYSFKYNQNEYRNYQSINLGYEVNIGDYYLVEFSYKNPQNSRIYYDYKLNKNKPEYQNYVGDTIPFSVLLRRKSTGRKF